MKQKALGKKKRQEKIEAATRDAALSLVDTARQDLAALEKMGEKETIHQVRVAMKRLRAFLRLVRGRLSEPEYQRINDRCRQLANDLSGSRDSDVAIDTLIDLGASGHPSGQSLLAALETDSDSATSRQPTDWIRVEQALDQIAHELVRMDLAGLRPKDLRKGLRKSYDKGLKAWRKARDCAGSELLHDWRKSVKHAYYQNQLLQSSKDKHTRRLKLLSDYLGDLHDLDMLQERLLARRRYYWQSDLEWLMPRLNKRRAALLAAALKEGKKVYANTTLKKRVEKVVA
ncbi:MAG: CHAD domain-containing protein [Oceanospirillaceae bacterium]|uniref:CHAD domain-containing protein n=1 Tax=Marinobacterium litorale TaxID=404770 RepID=UPI0003FDC5C4|nr:CHAD domain-containing protein [Marinobacterium litorale]MBS98280.1 CHAD domain-containing protein [Oceanospirillaceae bacterium]